MSSSQEVKTIHIHRVPTSRPQITSPRIVLTLRPHTVSPHHVPTSHPHIMSPHSGPTSRPHRVSPHRVCPYISSSQGVSPHHIQGVFLRSVPTSCPTQCPQTDLISASLTCHSLLMKDRAQSKHRIISFSQYISFPSLSN